MSIFKTKLNNYTQNFHVSKKNKSLYGEVRTDFKLIKDMFQLIPDEILKNPPLKWCDPCCGNGYFSIFLYFQLFKNLTEIKSLKKRHVHIINMMTMVEINKEYQKKYKQSIKDNDGFWKKEGKRIDWIKNYKKINIYVRLPSSTTRRSKNFPSQWSSHPRS